MEKEFVKVSSNFCFYNFTRNDEFQLLYGENVHAAIVDLRSEPKNIRVWVDLLNSLGRKITILVLSHYDKQTAIRKFGRVDHVNWLLNPSSDEIVRLLDITHSLGKTQQLAVKGQMPIMDPQIPANILKKIGSISMLTVDATQFQKVAIEHGQEAHNRLQEFFQSLLFGLWGSSGSFRAKDTLCRRTPDSNIYYIFLEQSRAASMLPAPGSLEKLTDRLSIEIQKKMWDELLRGKNSKIPNCLSIIPDFSIGYASSIFNPCIDLQEEIAFLFEESHNMAKVQLNRIKGRQKEFLQNIIRTDKLLKPHFQAVFHAQDLDKESIDSLNRDNDLHVLRDHIFGYESLIRINKDAAMPKVWSDGPIIFEPENLRPDVLFALAESTKLSLELDQACLEKATNEFGDFPSHLMVNILPRNIYYINYLKNLMPENMKLTFELSETEDIKNLELLLEVREDLRKQGFGIAADDFGKGYASFDRVLKVKPDIIKLDRSLIQDIDKDNPKKSFVSGLIEATKTSNSKILAEGIERWEELEVLLDLGVDYVQGFLLHRPESLERITEKLEQVDEDISESKHVA